MDEWATLPISITEAAGGFILTTPQQTAPESPATTRTIPESMNFKQKNSLPDHLQDGEGLPRSHQERLMWIRRRVEEGFYESDTVIKAVADAFLDPPDYRRAGEQALSGGQGRARLR